MMIYLENGDKHMSIRFPLSAIRLRDVLDCMNVLSGTEVRCRFPRYELCDLPDCVFEKYYTADIYKLNLFIDRYEQLENSEKAAFKSVLMRKPVSSIDEMLEITYGLDTVPTLACYSLSELGKTYVESGMMPELKDVPKEFLNFESIGKAIVESNEGVFVDDFFCKPNEYSRPNIEISIDVPEKEFFRFFVAPSANDMDKAQWVSLPRDEQLIYDMSKRTGLPLDALWYEEIESALPTFKDGTYEEDECVDEIIRLSKELAELPHHKFVKLKAILAAEDICVLGGIFDAIDSLDEYDLDLMIQDESQFGKTYACRVFSTNFDWNVIKDCDMYDFGQAVLKKKLGMVTDYGALSGRGQKLYTVITSSPEQTEEETEDEHEDLEMEMSQ